MIVFSKIKLGAAVMIVAAALCVSAFAQTTAVVKKAATAKRVKVIDISGLETLLKPNGKPLLINFWATWCDWCREEFPDLVKIDAAYKGKIDLVTVSLDDLAEIDGDVPKFLAEMKAEMPAYLLHATDESAAIQMVSKDWAGNLPLTIFMDASGKVVYQTNARVRLVTLKDNIDRVLDATPRTAGR